MYPARSRKKRAKYVQANCFSPSSHQLDNKQAGAVGEPLSLFSAYLQGSLLDMERPSHPKLGGGESSHRAHQQHTPTEPAYGPAASLKRVDRLPFPLQVVLRSSALIRHQIQQLQRTRMDR